MEPNNIQDSDLGEFVSKEGFEELTAELKALKEARLAIAQKLEFAKSLGDLSENAEYSEAKEEHMVNESRIAQLEDFLSRAKIIQKKTGDQVQLGSTVTVSDGKVEHAYTIVGTQEVDVAAKRISHESPFGQAFLGRRKGEKVIVRTPKGEVAYTIQAIS